MFFYFRELLTWSMLGLGIAAFALVVLGYMRTRKLIFWRCLTMTLALVNAVHLSPELDEMLFQSLLTAMLFTMLWHWGPVVLIVPILWFIVSPNFRRCHPCGSGLTSCKSNLKNTATALEMYSTDNRGRYPHTLGQLTPNYLKIIPNCPSTQRNDYIYSSTMGPDAFTIYCFGNHTDAKTPPTYSSYEGLIERP